VTIAYRDLREFIDLSRDLGQVRDLSRVGWDVEMGAVIEAVAERLDPAPLLLFDDFADVPAGHRVAALTLASVARCAIALGLDPEASKLELIRSGYRLIQQAVAHPVGPHAVSTGPLCEHVATGEDVDLLRFPAPRFRAEDGGRYIGTGVAVINRDPQSGYVNVGTYRVQLHDQRTLGLWMSPGQQGREICAAYWREGRSAPVAMVFGMDPAVFMCSHGKVPWGTSELDVIGGLYGEPLDVIAGAMTGLPIPARAELAIEGEIPPPDVESRLEGPFGEWPGYYAVGTVGPAEQQPVVHVKAVYHRTSPILLAQPPTWYGAPTRALPFESGALWGQLESAGISGITGVFQHTMYFIVVSIRQLYAGHAKQAGLGVLACAAGARNGRYVVVVDEDIDVTSMDEVLWAIQTRSDPATDIDVLAGMWSSPLDPRMTPASREAKDHTNSRAVIYAVRPFAWRDSYPRVSRIGTETKDAAFRRYISDPLD
jgi:4-hydroxy-3-polyprenylbenzoate decarboxylase